MRKYGAQVYDKPPKPAQVRPSMVSATYLRVARSLTRSFPAELHAPLIASQASSQDSFSLAKTQPTTGAGVVGALVGATVGAGVVVAGVTGALVGAAGVTGTKVGIGVLAGAKVGGAGVAGAAALISLQRPAPQKPAVKMVPMNNAVATMERAKYTL